MGQQNILIVARTTKEPGDLSFTNWGPTRVINELRGALDAFGMGNNTGTLDVQLAPSYSAGVVLSSAGAGVETATIGGRAVSATFATSDANTCDLLAAAINADATAKTYVVAGSRTATGTLTIAAGAGAITATFFVPGPSGAGPSVTAVSVTWATSDTATAAALAAAVNSTKNLPIIASSAAGVVTFYYNPPLFDAYGPVLTGAASFGLTGNSIGLQGSGTGVTVSGATLAGGGTNANVLVQGLVPGTMGNGITLTGAGTGVSVPTGANLVGGLGGPGNSSAM